MNICVATPEDAPAISSLILELSAPFYAHPDRLGAESFLESIDEVAERRYLSAENFHFLVARMDDKIVGVAALRDCSHLFHLFVSKSVQRKGLGRALWKEISDSAIARQQVSSFTVNASLIAIPFYERLGFHRVGAPVQTHGILFQSMKMEIEAGHQVTLVGKLGSSPICGGAARRREAEHPTPSFRAQSRNPPLR